MALKELLVAFGVEVDAKDLDGVEGKITNLMGGLKKLGGLLLGGAVVKGTLDFIKTQVDAADALQTTADKLGVGSEELQRFTYAADLLDVSSQTAANGLKFLNKNIGEAAAGNKEAAAAFAKLGIETKNSDGSMRSSVDIMGDAADSFAAMTNQGDKTALAMKLFGKSGVDMIPMLASGGDAVRSLMAEVDDLGGVMSQDFINKAGEADNAMKRFHYATNMAKVQLSSALIPAFTALVKKGTELVSWFVRLSKETNGVQNLMKILGVAAGGFLVLKLNNLIKAAGGVNKALKSAFNLGAKELLIIGSVILLVLLIEDLITFIQGGDSIIGDFFDKFLGHDEALAFAAQLRDIWSQVGDAFKTVGPQLAGIMTQLGPVAAQALPVLVKGLVQVIKLVSAGAALLGGFVSGIGAVVDGKGFDGFAAAAAKAGETVFGKQVSTVDARTGAVTTKNVGGLYGDAVPVPGAGVGGAGGSTTNQVSQTNQTTINVNGSTDPLATADAVAQKQARVNDQANRNALGAVKVTK